MSKKDNKSFKYLHCDERYYAYCFVCEKEVKSDEKFTNCGKCNSNLMVTDQEKLTSRYEFRG